jgi:uncharacterized membrane protein YqiK
VKTGAGGKRVIMDGSTIVIPLLYEISPVSMKTRRLEVKRAAEQALITKDRMRVDMGAEFYVSVQATEDGIARAAQTLGDKTFNMEALRDMIEGKLIDGLRAVAAQISCSRWMRARAIEETQITKEREIAVANQERCVMVAQKSEEESRARASADTARAEAMKAAEAIETARAVAETERQKQIAIIEATREAERGATRLRLAAEAERAAAEDYVAARREEGQGEADALSIRAEAKKKDLLAEAEGREAFARLQALPDIIAQMVKPTEKIESIHINQIGGLGLGGTGMGSAGDGKSPVNQAFDAMLGAALQLPAMKKLGEELGMNFEDGLSGLLETPKANGHAAEPAKAIEPPAAPAVKAPR